MPPNKAQNRAPQLGGKTRHQSVTKTRSFRGIFAMVRTGKAKQAKRFSFLTTQLTRWRSAVRARTGLPFPSWHRFTFFGANPLADFTSARPTIWPDDFPSTIVPIPWRPAGEDLGSSFTERRMRCCWTLAGANCKSRDRNPQQTFEI